MTNYHDQDSTEHYSNLNMEIHSKISTRFLRFKMNPSLRKYNNNNNIDGTIWVKTNYRYGT